MVGKKVKKHHGVSYTVLFSLSCWALLCVYFLWVSCTLEFLYIRSESFQFIFHDSILFLQHLIVSHLKPYHPYKLWPTCVLLHNFTQFFSISVSKWIAAYSYEFQYNTNLLQMWYLLCKSEKMRFSKHLKHFILHILHSYKSNIP